MIHCGDPSYGGAMFACPDCGELKFSAFRCKSRFCTSCGNKYNQLRAFRMSCKLVNCTHRHCVFTILEELRLYFLKDRELLNCLFHSVKDVILRMFYKMNKSENFTPGFVLVLHTFGRDLKWNPHIHALVSEGGASNYTVWRHVKHFDFKFLRKAFCKVLLEQLSKNLANPSVSSKMKSTKTIPMVFTYVLRLNVALLTLQLNISAVILEDLLSQLPVLTIMMVNMLPFTTHGMKTMKL